jgi:hypothetical protein
MLWSPMYFWDTLRGGIGKCIKYSFGHEQYPFNSLDQNNSTHGVYSLAQ